MVHRPQQPNIADEPLEHFILGVLIDRRILLGLGARLNMQRSLLVHDALGAVLTSDLLGDVEVLPRSDELLVADLSLWPFFDDGLLRPVGVATDLHFLGNLRWSKVVV